MESNRKKFYYILTAVTLTLFAIIIFYPSKKSINTLPEEAVTVTTAETVTGGNIKIESAEKDNGYYGREPERDIFTSRYEQHNNEQSAESAVSGSDFKEIKEEIKPPVVKGIFLSENGNSFLTGDGKLIGEGEKVDNLKVMKILKEEVIFEKPDGKIIKVNIWEE